MDEGFLGLTVGSLPLKAPAFIAAGTDIAGAARAMRAASATACLAGTPDALEGIVSERDVVRAVAEGWELSGPVSGIMSRGVVAVPKDELVAEAFLLMIRHNIRRLAVTDEAGHAVAMLEERDLMGARLESPVALSAAMARAASGEDLARAYSGLGGLIPRWLAQGADVTRTGALAAAVRDQLLVRAAELALAGGPPPGPMALCVLGSEGRREQFLATDQDNALVIGPGGDEAKAGAFARRLMAILDEAGLPPCPHGVTADREAWRMTLAGWEEHLSELARDVGPEAVLHLSLLADARHVFGDPSLTEGLRKALLAALKEHPRALRYMAREAVRFDPPLNMLGALVAERGGPGRGGVDLKRGGIFPLTQGARVLALQYGMERTDTHSRLLGAAEAGVISSATASDLSQAMQFLLELRLRFQAQALAEGREPDSFVHPERISGLERARLKECFKAVAAFQKILSNKYALHLLT